MSEAEEGRRADIPVPRYAVPLLKPARYKGLFGGRGSSKSWTLADNLIDELTRDPNASAVCLREVQGSLKESVKRLLERRITAHGLTDCFEFRENEIRCVGGEGKIVFHGLQGQTAESIKSLEGFKFGWIEEAQTISQRSLDILRPTLRMPGSEIWASWNPRRPTDPIDVLLRGEVKPDNAIVIEVNYTDNPDFPDELRKEMEFDRAHDPDKFAHVWLGAYETASEARVFRNWRVDDKIKAPADGPLYFGADWGFAVDPTVLLRCWIVGRELFVDEEVSEVGVEIQDTPAFFDRIEGSRAWTIVADSARPETISHMRKHGFKVIPATKGPSSVKDGVEFLKGYNIVVHPRCEALIADLVGYRYKTDPLTNRVMPVLDDKGYHENSVSALRYALEAVRRAVPPSKPAAKATPVVSHWSR